MDALCIDFFRYLTYRSHMASTPGPQSTPPSSFREVIGRWPATRFFARDAGCSALLVRQWRHRNFIPPQYWPGIVAAATRRGIAHVDADLLARLAAALRGGQPRPDHQPAPPRSRDMTTGEPR